MHLKINAEYECSPFWVSDDGKVFTHLEIQDSPFNEELKASIEKWAFQFEGTLDQDYPPNSGFDTESEEREFEEMGFRIWAEILSEYSLKYEKIIYKSYSSKKEYFTLEEYLKGLPPPNE